MTSQKDLRENQAKFYLKTGVISAILLLLLLGFWKPITGPWAQERQGLAKLRAAEYTNKIQAEQSAAELEAAKIRAKAVAIVGAAAKEFPEFRAQEFIAGFAEAVRQGTIDQTFYIPTKDSVPMLSAMAIPEPSTAPVVE